MTRFLALFHSKPISDHINAAMREAAEDYYRREGVGDAATVDLANKAWLEFLARELPKRSGVFVEKA